MYASLLSDPFLPFPSYVLYSSNYIPQDSMPLWLPVGLVNGKHWQKTRKWKERSQNISSLFFLPLMAFPVPSASLHGASSPPDCPSLCDSSFPWTYLLFQLFLDGHLLSSANATSLDASALGVVAAPSSFLFGFLAFPSSV